MIEINSDDKSIEKDIYEFTRACFPSYEFSNHMSVTISTFDKYIDIRCEKFNYKFPYEEKSYGTKKSIRYAMLLNLKEDLESELNWGILTGIRPTKLVRSILEKNSESETNLILKNEYLFNSDTASMSLDIVNREKRLIGNFGHSDYSIYIHIPFCPTKCNYCSFKTLSSSSNLLDSYIDALVEEIKRESIYFNSNPISIYIGGGTPTSIGINNLRKVLKAVNLYLKRPLEYTVECGRPDTIDEDILNLLREYGVNRISINPQSMNEETLKKISRAHTIDDIYEKYQLARNFDFNINMDLIIGLADEDRDMMMYSLEKVLELGPENITIHTLSVKNGSKLLESRPEHFSNISEVSHLIKKRLENSDYFPYYLYRQKRILSNGENIGYSLEGFECIYNMLMIEENTNVYGFGLSASSKIFTGDRFKTILNFKDIHEYLNRNFEISERKIKIYRERELI